MNLNESEDTEPFSPVLGPIRNPLRVSLLRSPAPSDGQDSDATEEGVIAPVRIGHLQRVDELRSPGPSEGQDSDATEDGLIAPVALGNQQRLTDASLTEAVEERSAQINFDIDAVQNVEVEDALPGQGTDGDQPEYADGIIMMTPPRLGYEDEPMGDEQDEALNPPVGALPTSDVVPQVHDVAGPSNRPDGAEPSIPEVTSGQHSVQEEVAIIPVIVNYPPAHLRPDTSESNNEASSSHNVGETARAESGPPVAVAPTSGPSDHERDDSVPPCKRQKLSDSPVAPPPPKPPVDDSEDDDGLTCTICLDQWTSSGEHRLVSLKCGHLFGFACIERWIKNQKAPERKCPTCKSKAKMSDVRNLYGNKIQMIDTTELEEFRGKNKELEKEKESLEREVGFLRKQNDELQVKHREALMLIQTLKSEKMVQRPTKRANEVAHVKYRASLVQTLELSKTEGCRVIAFNEQRCLIAASVPSPTNLFKEYALKLIDAESFRPRQTMPSHSRMIRDVAFSNDGKMLLSCSLDKTANVLDMDSNTSLATLTSEMPIWSVCWDADNPWLLFTGAQNGIVRQYDIRAPGQELSRVVVDGNYTPVASLAGIPKESGVGWLQGGFISCRFRHLCPYERTDGGFKHHPCSIDGLFTSLRYERRTEHILVSTRPTEKSPRAQHMLFQMSALGNVPQYNLVQNFFGSTTLGVISRSCVMPIMSPQGEVEDLLVSSYVESESHIGLWSCSSGQKLQHIQSSEIIMDLCPIYANGKNYLSTLSDKKIRLYKVEKS